MAGSAVEAAGTRGVAGTAVAAAGTRGVAGPAAATITGGARLAATSSGRAGRSDDPDGRSRDGTAGWRHDVADGRRRSAPAVRGRPQ